MASYHNLLQHTKQQFESPAKVFAKLKSKVQREAMCAEEGVFLDKDPQCNVNIRDKHGADFNSPRKRADAIWKTDGLKENRRFGSYRDEVEAVTLSPIASPQKSFRYRYSFLDNGSKHVEKMPPVTETEHAFISSHGRALTKRTFLESTALSPPTSVVNRQQILTEPTQIRDLDDFIVNTTPVKIRPVNCVGGVFEEERASQDNLISPANIYSPMKRRLRKRKWDQDLNKASSSNTKAINAEVVSQSRERKTSPVVSDDDSHNNTGMEEFGGVRGFPAGRSEMKQFSHELIFPPPRSTADKRCHVIMEKIPLMSPAKMFAFMKERESKRERQAVHEVSNSRRELFNEGDFLQPRDSPPFTAHNMCEMEDIHFQIVPESVVPVKRSRVETTNSQSHPSEDVLVPATQSQPVLLEDPLVLNSPSVFIPKKYQAVFKRNKLPQCEKFPSESVIYLKQWFLRKTHKGLFVDGIHREENIPWNSNIIVDRVSNSVVKTVSGRVYILVGKMKLDIASGFPKWFLKNFVNGFPPNWKALYEKFISESRDIDSSRVTENSEGRNRRAKKMSEVSSINLKQHKQKPFKTPVSCPPASSTKVSRSGRTIKPPLEYWKGGRVILDAHMNVTIHEAYDTSICIPEVTTTVSARKSQKPTRVFLPCSEGRKQCESASEEEVSVPLRMVKAPPRKRNQTKIGPKERPSNPPEPVVGSLEECSRRTRSSQRRPATERMLHVDTVPQKQRDAEKASTHKSKKQTDVTNKHSVRSKKQTVSTSPESLTVKTSQQQLSDDDFSIKRKKQKKGEHRKRGRKVLNESQPNHSSLSSQSSEISEDSGKKVNRRNRVTKNSDAAQTRRKSNRTSPPTRPSPKSTQSRKKHKTNKGSTVVPQEQDEEKWTEAELIKLQEAVSYYPKHMTGYWEKVARIVGTRSAAECHHQHTSQGTSQTPAKKTKKPIMEKEAAREPVTEHPVITAGVGTFKRKQQVREFLEAMPREDVDDIFSSAYMQNKRFEMPSMCPSDDHDFTMSELEPLTPMSKIFPDVKTPQCLHITPGMMGSPNRNNDDKYVFQLQKRMKKNQFNVCKQASSSKSFTPTPSAKRTMRRCGNTENDTFVVWEMFPGNEGIMSESGEEEDFYFSDND